MSVYETLGGPLAPFSSLLNIAGMTASMRSTMSTPDGISTTKRSSKRASSRSPSDFCLPSPRAFGLAQATTWALKTITIRV